RHTCRLPQSCLCLTVFQGNDHLHRGSAQSHPHWYGPLLRRPQSHYGLRRESPHPQPPQLAVQHSNQPSSGSFQSESIHPVTKLLVAWKVTGCYFPSAPPPSESDESLSIYENALTSPSTGKASISTEYRITSECTNCTSPEVVSWPSGITSRIRVPPSSMSKMNALRGGIFAVCLIDTELPSTVTFSAP